MKKFRLNFLIVCAPILLGACAPTFHCSNGMKGKGCNSVSQVYENTHQGKPMSQVYKESHSAVAKVEPLPPAELPPTGLPQTIQPGDPLRSGARVLRVWLAPWVDKDGDYHDQSYIYLVLNHGRWYIDQARRHIERHFAPHVSPPQKATSKQGAGTGGDKQGAAIASAPQKPNVPLLK